MRLHSAPTQRYTLTAARWANNFIPPLPYYFRSLERSTGIIELRGLGGEVRDIPKIRDECLAPKEVEDIEDLAGDERKGGERGEASGKRRMKMGGRLERTGLTGGTGRSKLPGEFIFTSE